MPRIQAPAALLCVLMLVVVLASSCTRIPPQRTLPASIRTIYMPMVTNRSAEPGIEEIATVMIQEEFLADGRLDLVRRGDADALIFVKIMQYDPTPSGFDQDDFVRGETIEMEAEIEIVRNIAGKPMVGPERVVRIRDYRNADKRAISFEPEPRAREGALRRLSQAIVREVITGRLPEPEDQTQ